MAESKVTQCKQCGDDIVWMKTQKDKNIAVDVESCDPERDTLYVKATMSCHFDTCGRGDRRKESDVRQETPASSDSSVNAKRLNAALKTLEDISKGAPDGIRSKELAGIALSQIRALR